MLQEKGLVLLWDNLVWMLSADFLSLFIYFLELVMGDFRTFLIGDDWCLSAKICITRERARGGGFHQVCCFCLYMSHVAYDA